MMNLSNEIKNIEKNLDQLLKIENDSSCGNVRDIEEYEDYYENYNKKYYLEFYYKGIYHYYLARVLLNNYIYGAGLFFCQQSIELMLKSFLIFKKISSKKLQTHDLIKLLNISKENINKQNINELFLNSEYTRIIAKKFNPFNEWGRYPIAKKGPKGKAFGFGSYEIKYLDYFIYKMRQIIKTDFSPSEIIFSIRQGSKLNDFFIKDNINCNI